MYFEGYSSNFYPIDNIEIPVSKKGAVYFDNILENYSKEFGFKTNGFYDVNTGWYRVGAYSNLGEVIEITTNTLINLERGVIKAIYFKTQIVKE